MVDYLKEIDNGLIIEEPKIVLPWSLQKKDLFDLINSINFVNENYYNNFNNHQLILENIFGKPSRNKLLEKFKEVNIEFKWRFRYVTIIHKLWNRFGMEEVLNIFINK